MGSGPSLRYSEPAARCHLLRDTGQAQSTDTPHHPQARHGDLDHPRPPHASGPPQQSSPLQPLQPAQPPSPGSMNRPLWQVSGTAETAGQSWTLINHHTPVGRGPGAATPALPKAPSREPLPLSRQAGRLLASPATGTGSEVGTRCHRAKSLLWEAGWRKNTWPLLRPVGTPPLVPARPRSGIPVGSKELGAACPSDTHFTHSPAGQLACSTENRPTKYQHCLPPSER